MMEERKMEMQNLSCKEGFLQGVVTLMMFIVIILLPAYVIRGMVGISKAPVPTVPDYVLMVPELIPLTVIAGFTAAAICDSLGNSKLKTAFMKIIAFCLVLLIAEGFVFVYLVGKGLGL